jgi:hypothetical protein
MSDKTHESLALFDNCAGIEYPRGFQATTTTATKQETRRLGTVHLGHQDAGWRLLRRKQFTNHGRLVFWLALVLGVLVHSNFKYSK